MLYLFTIFSPCFGRHSGHLQGDALTREYKNTNVVVRITITLHFLLTRTGMTLAAMVEEARLLGIYVR
jgi:hypothetical protein